EILSADREKKFTAGSGRLELAEAISSPENPLTARVIVNRVWGQFFGQPLVSTPSNFGHSGQRPSYPELLDDLAVRFMAEGWSRERLIREIVLSATSRQGSEPGLAEDSPGHRAPGVNHSRHPALEKARVSDPNNELLWRMNRKRLTIEEWRDAILAVSGRL